MKKVLLVARREFVATVLTKGFLVGILITPVIIALSIAVLPRLLNRTPPRIEGQVAIVDPTGQVAGPLREYLSPEQFVKRREESKRRIAKVQSKVLERAPARSPETDAAMKQSIDAALGTVPQLDIRTVDPAADLEAEKGLLMSPRPEGSPASGQRLALVVVHADAVQRAAEAAKFGTYDLYVRGKIDDRLVDDICGGLREAIVDARVRDAGLKRSEITALTSVERPQSRTVTAAGESETNEELNVLLPAGFMVLLLVSVLTSGQYLLTTTVEEKSNRVVEILLSAVSSMELMVGKILGEMAVGMLVLILYTALGISALLSFALLGLLDPSLILFLIIFYLLAYLTIASFMAAIGSAVNEMREAQSMMTPVMLVVSIPWILWLPISRDPNSLFAAVLSFVPPLGSFVMLLRMTSTAPPPTWQVWMSILVGAAGAYVAVWFAAKVFRVGLLMFGKPPNFKTLVRWARMA